MGFPIKYGASFAAVLRTVIPAYGPDLQRVCYAMSKFLGYEVGYDFILKCRSGVMAFPAALVPALIASLPKKRQGIVMQAIIGDTDYVWWHFSLSRSAMDPAAGRADLGKLSDDAVAEMQDLHQAHDQQRATSEAGAAVTVEAVDAAGRSMVAVARVWWRALREQVKARMQRIDARGQEAA